MVFMETAKLFLPTETSQSYNIAPYRLDLLKDNDNFSLSATVDLLDNEQFKQFLL